MYTNLTFFNIKKKVRDSHERRTSIIINFKNFIIMVSQFVNVSMPVSFPFLFRPPIFHCRRIYALAGRQ